MEYTLMVTINVYLLAAIAALLILFGVWYNAKVEDWEHDGSDRGYMSFIVAIGCSAVILGYSLATSLWLALPLLICFAAAGVPMMLGSVRRYLAARAAEERQRDRHSLDQLGDG